MMMMMMIMGWCGHKIFDRFEFHSDYRLTLTYGLHGLPQSSCLHTIFQQTTKRNFMVQGFHDNFIVTQLINEFLVSIQSNEILNQSTILLPSCILI